MIFYNFLTDLGICLDKKLIINIYGNNSSIRFRQKSILSYKELPKNLNFF